MKKIVIQFLVLMLIITSPIIALNIVDVSVPSQYSETFLARLPHMYEKIENTKEKKIVFIGTSSIPFGVLPSFVMEELPEYKCVNFGLYGMLGIKIMLDLAKKSINENDMVILSPELNPQTYSLYFNSEATRQALENNRSMASELPLANRLNYLYQHPVYTIDKWKQYSSNTPITNIAPYSYDSFNEFDEIKTPRKYNVMQELYDESMVINYKDLLDREFIDYINDFNEFVSKKNAKVFFSFAPTNSLAVDPTLQDDFYNNLTNLLDFDVLGKPSDFVYDYKYFYDSNFHLNEAGAILHTQNLINFIKLKLNISELTNVSIPEVKDPERKPIINGDNSDVNCFVYVDYGMYYGISGVKDEYKEKTSLIIPSNISEKPIEVINSDAIKDCSKLTSLTIQENINTIKSSFINNCPRLRYINILNKDPNSIMIPGKDLLNGCSSFAKIYVYEEAIYSYRNHYTWRNYIKYLAIMED